MTTPEVNGTTNGHDAIVQDVPPAAILVPEQLPAQWRRWLSRTAVATRLSMNHRQVQKAVDQGQLPPPTDCPDGSQRWNPETIEAYEDALSENNGETVAVGRAAKDMSTGLARLVQQATSHNERAFVQYERATAASMATLRATNQDLSADNQRLRDELAKREELYFKLVEQRESLLSEQAARDIAQRESTATADRKKKMFEIVMQRAPGLLGKLEKHLGLGDGADLAKVNAVIELAETLDPGLLELLAGNGALSAAQVVLVEKIIGKKINKAAAAAEEKKEDAPTQPA